MSDEELEWASLSTEEKILHNVWKVRVAGYEEVAQLFESLEEDEECPEYAGLFKRFVADTNAYAQQRGLEAVKAFLKNGSLTPEIAQEIVESTVAECFCSRRLATCIKGKEVILYCVEAGQPEVVDEVLIKGLGNKNTKVVIGCIECLKEGLRDFGSTIIQVDPILAVLPKLMKHTSNEVREETKDLLSEIYRWTGPHIKQHLEELNTAQLEELNLEFKKQGGQKPIPVRFLKGQKECMSKSQRETSSEIEDERDTQSSIQDAYADQAKSLIDDVIELAIKRLETSLSKSDKEVTFESLRKRQMSQESILSRDEDYDMGSIYVLSIEDFSVRSAKKALHGFIQTWSYDKSWLYCIDYLGWDDHEFDERYRFRVEWSIPTRRKPIPRATARVYFTFHVSKVKPKDLPVDVYYVFETQRLVHRPGESRFREKWLKDIIESKVQLFSNIDF